MKIEASLHGEGYLKILNVSDGETEKTEFITHSWGENQKFRFCFKDNSLVIEREIPILGGWEEIKEIYHPSIIEALKALYDNALKFAIELGDLKGA